MVETNKVTIVVGILIVLLLSGIVYVSFGDKARIRVDEDKTTFYVKESGRWVVSGREYNKLFDGTSSMYRRASNISVETFIDEQNEIVKITRKTPYIRGPVIVDTYNFDGKIDDIKLFPISHTVEIFNGSGYFYRYEVRDLVYDGPRIKLDTTSMTFGRNMKVEWQDGYRWAWVYADGILKVQYDINSDYEVYNVRLFDPPVVVDENVTHDALQYGANENIVRDSNGNLFSVYEDITGPAHFANSSDNGVSWDNKSLGTANIGILGMVVDSDDDLFVYYRQTVIDTTVLFYQNSSDSGLTWNGPYIAFNVTRLVDSLISCVPDSNDIIHCIASNGTPGGRTLLYTNSSNWSDTMLINSNIFDGSGLLDIEIGRNGCIYVTSTADVTYSNVLNFWSDCANGWGYANKIEVYNINRALLPTIAVSPDNDVYIAWYNESGELYFSNSSDNGTTWNTTQIGDNGTNPDISVTEDGDIYIMFIENTTKNLAYANSSDGGVTWDNHTVITSENSNHPSIAQTSYPLSNRIYGELLYIYNNITVPADIIFDTLDVTDSIAPQITIISPTNITYDVSSIIFNISSNEPLDFCNFSIDGNVTAYDMAEENVFHFSYTNSSMLNDVYTANFWCNDTSGNINSSESIGFTVNPTSPNISFIPPTPANATTRPFEITMNVSVTELSLDNISFEWNGTNETIFDVSSTSIYANFTINSMSDFSFNNGSEIVTFYDEDLVLMMDMNNVSAIGDNSTYTVDVSRYENNGTFTGDPTWISGKYGTGLDLDGTDDIRLPNVPSLNIVSNITMMAWIKTTSGGEDHIIGGYQPGGSFQGYAMAMTIGCSAGRLAYFAGGSWQCSTNPVNTGNWIHAVIVGTTSFTKIYLNGTLDSTTGANIPESYAGTRAIGSRAGSSYYFTGLVDGVRIYNRTLSDTEIKQIYNTNFHKYDTSSWGFNTNQTLGNFSFDIDGVDTLDFNKYNSTGYVLDINKDELDDGNYTYQACASDDNLNINCTEQRTITIDNPPTIYVSSPTNTIYNTSAIWFNASANEAIDTWIVNYNGTNVTHTINTTLIVEDGTHNLLMYGNDSVGNWAVNNSVSFTVDTTAPTIDFVPPTPEDAYVTSSNFTEINVSITDISFEGVILDWNGSNTTYYLNGSNTGVDFNFENSTVGSCPTGWVCDGDAVTVSAIPVTCGGAAGNIEGVNYLKVACDATVGSTNSSNFVLPTSIDRMEFTRAGGANSPSGVYLKYSSNNTIIASSLTGTDTNVLFPDEIASLSDYAGVEVSVYTLDATTGGWGKVYLDNFTFWDSSDNKLYAVETLTNYSATDWNFYINQSNLSDGTYTYQVCAFDGGSNENCTEERTITVDLTSPDILFVDPTPDDLGNATSSNVTINISINESSLGEVIYNWDGTNYTLYNDSLVLMYNFDNVSAIGENTTNAVDVSAQGNNGTLTNNAVWNVSGKYNGAVGFDGDNDYVRIEDDPSLQITENITLMIWVYVDDYDNFNGLISKSKGANPAPYDFYLVQTTGIPRFFMGNGNIGQSDEFDGTTAPGLGAWHHLVVTRTGTDVVHYLDGVINGVDAGFSPVSTADDGDEVYIGNRQDLVTDFDGLIDEVRVWNKVLSATEINQSYMSNLNKYDIDKWILYVNQIESPGVLLDNGTYTYQGFASDSLGNWNATEQRTIEVLDGGVAPTLTDLTIFKRGVYPTEIVELDDFNSSWNVTDETDPTILCNVNWTNNAVPEPVFDTNVNCTSGATCYTDTLVTSPYTAVGEVWEVNVSCTDSTLLTNSSIANITIRRHCPRLYCRFWPNCVCN